MTGGSRRPIWHGVALVAGFWWFATGLIFALQRNATTRLVAMLLFSGLAVAAVWAIRWSRHERSPRAMAAAFLGNENAAQAAYAHTRGWVSWMARVGGYDAPRKVLDHLLDDDLSFDDSVRLGAGLSPVLIDDGWRDHLKSDLSWVPGFLGQLLFGAILVAAVVLGSRKVALRRTKVMDKWAKEEPPVLDPPTTPPQPLP